MLQAKLRTSTNRILANRRNATRSTGPRTKAGKARSRLNRLKHGLRAQVLVLPDEDPAAFQGRLDAWTAELDPRTEVERRLVADIVHASWRLDRCHRAEIEALTERVLQAEERAQKEIDRRAELEIAWLTREPGVGLVKMRRTSRGCRWLLESWQAVLEGLEAPAPGVPSWPTALMGKRPDDWLLDPEAHRLVVLHLGAAAGGRPEDEARAYVRGALREHRPDILTKEEFETRVGAIAAELPDPERARAELRAWIHAVMAELRQRLEVVEAREREDRVLAVEEAMVDDSAEGAARHRYEQSYQRAFARALRDLRAAQAERRASEAAGLETVGRAEPPRGPAARTEPNVGAVESVETAEAIAPTEPNAGAVGPCERATDEIAPTEPNAAADVLAGTYAEVFEPTEPNTEAVGRRARHRRERRVLRAITSTLGVQPRARRPNPMSRRAGRTGLRPRGLRRPDSTPWRASRPAGQMGRPRRPNPISPGVGPPGRAVARRLARAPTEPNRDRDGLGRGPERAGKNDPDRERRATRKFLLRLPDSVVRRLAPSVSWSLW